MGTFAFWATGAAKFAHEMAEHHGGRDACADANGCDDDDGCVAIPTVAAPTDRPARTSDHPKHACPVCQMLAAMAVDRPAPPALPPPSLGLVAVLVIADWQSPTVRPPLTRFCTGPPAGPSTLG